MVESSLYWHYALQNGLCLNKKKYSKSIPNSHSIPRLDPIDYKSRYPIIMEVGISGIPATCRGVTRPPKNNV